MGVIALICALLLVGYSIVSVYGFMSTRITHLERHNRIVAYQQGAIDWTRKTIINRDLPQVGTPDAPRRASQGRQRAQSGATVHP